MEPTPIDFGATITAAFGDFVPQLLLVAAAGLAIAFVMWGFPKAVGFFKKVAK